MLLCLIFFSKKVMFLSDFQVSFLDTCNFPFEQVANLFFLSEEFRRHCSRKLDSAFALFFPINPFLSRSANDPQGTVPVDCCTNATPHSQEDHERFHFTVVSLALMSYNSKLLIIKEEFVIRLV